MEIIKIMERIAMIEAAMETKNRRIAVLEVAMTAKDLQLSELQQEMKSLSGRINVTEETDIQLKEKVDQVRWWVWIFPNPGIQNIAHQARDGGC